MYIAIREYNFTESNPYYVQGSSIEPEVFKCVKKDVRVLFSDTTLMEYLKEAEADKHSVYTYYSATHIRPAIKYTQELEFK